MLGAFRDFKHSAAGDVILVPLALIKVNGAFISLVLVLVIDYDASLHYNIILQRGRVGFEIYIGLDLGGLDVGELVLAGIRPVLILNLFLYNLLILFILLTLLINININ